MAQVSDTDRDGIPNTSDPFPTVNAVIADPDGNNNLSAGLQTALSGRWDCENLVVSGANHRFADIAGGDQPLDCRQLSMGIDNAGMISKGALFDAGNDHLAAPGTLFHNQAAFTTSLWFKTPPGYVQNKAGSIHTVFFACNGALDAYPELIVSIYKGVPGATTQKITVNRYNGTTVAMTFFGEIPVADYLDDGYWHHLAYVKNGNNNRLFVNGVKIKEANLTNGTLTATTAGYICYGKNVPIATDQGHTFRGSMDRLRFYSRNLSDTEVSELYRQDSDRDGHWDIVEKEWTGVYPMSPFYWQSSEVDTDGDGLPDDWERLHGMDPLSAVGVNGAAGDREIDGVTNINEFQNRTNPNMVDTDGDGATDAVEIAQGSNPNSAADQGLPPTDPIETVNFGTWGDYATWRMSIKGEGPRDFRELFVTAPNFNQPKNQDHKLWKNNQYKITLRFIASRPDLPDIWYCWEAKVDGFPTTATFPQLANYQIGSRNTNNLAKLIKNHWILDNSPGLLTTHLDSKGTDKATPLSATLKPITFITPAGDPVAAPVEAGFPGIQPPDGANEFVYSTSNPGVLTVFLKASTPGINLLSATDRAAIKFDLDAVTGSQFAWNAANPTGTPTIYANTIEASATYTGLPASNTAFGQKQARLKLGTVVSSTAKYEVFFPKGGTNHPGTGPYPGPRPPNWFYYWSQFIPKGRIQTLNYGFLNNGYGRTEPIPRVTTIDPAAGGTNNETNHTGIHSFYEVVAHENHHIVLWEGWWGPGGIAVGPRDTDSDLYPVEFETSTTGIAYGFDPALNDAFAGGRKTPVTTANEPDASPGYNYEEDICRQVEMNLLETRFDHFDWSNDPQIKGKNQKK